MRFLKITLRALKEFSMCLSNRDRVSLRLFLLIVFSPALVFSYGSPSYIPDGPHPKLLLTSSMLSQLSNKVAANDSSWLLLKAKADLYATYTVAAYSDATTGTETNGTIFYSYQGSNWLDAAQILGLAYKVTGNAAYADKLIELSDVMATATYPATISISKDAYYPTRNLPTAAALIFDWIYDYAPYTPAKKTALIATVNGWYDASIAHAYQIAGPATSNYFGGHILGFGLWGLATYGDNARSGEINSTIRGLWDTKIVPSFETGGFKGGYPIQSFNYGPTHFVRLLEYANGVHTATGQNIYPSNVNKIAQSLLYNLMPSRWQSTDEGTMPNAGRGVMQSTLAVVMSGILPLDDPIGDQIAFYSNNLSTPPTSSNAPSIFEKALYGINRTQADYRTVQPLYYRSLGDEHLYYRSDWTDSAVWSSFAGSGSIDADHQSKAAGHIAVTRGNDYLLVNVGQWKGLTGYTGTPTSDDKSSSALNTLFFNDGGAYMYTGSAYKGGQGLWGTPTVLKSELTTSYVYEKADLTSHYSNGVGASGLNYFHRNYVNIGGTTIIVYDITNAKSSSYTKELRFHLHNQSSNVNSDGTIQSTLGNSRVFLKPISNEILTLDTSDVILTLPRVRISPTSVATIWNPLTVIATGSSIDSMPPTDQVTSNDGKMIGTYIKNTSKPNVVMFSNDPSGNDVTGNVTYTLSAPNGKSPWHTIVHLPVNTDCTVVRPINSVVPQTYQLLMENSPAKGQVYKTSSQGVLRLPPDISIQAPTDGATVAGKKKVTVSIPDTFTVTTLELLVDGVSIASTFTPPNVVQPDSLLPVGSHQLAVLATDADGNKSLSAPITVTVVTDSVAPTVTISSPSEGQIVSGSVTVSISADDAFDVANVRLYVDGGMNGLIGAAPFSISWNTLLSGTGPHTLTADASDSSGNMGVSSAVNVTVDNASPGITSFSVPVTSASLTISGISVAASDNIGVTGYLITENNSPPAASAVNLYPTPTSYSASTAGPKTLYAWARDAAGNVSAVFTGQPCLIDTTKPTVNSFTIPVTSSSLTISNITLTASDNIGVTGYLITESNTPPAASAVSLTPAPNNYTAATAGSKTLYAWVRDAAGNVSAVFTGQPCVIDTTAPAVTSFSVPAISGNLTVSSITLTASDNIGVTGYLITESNTPPAASAVNLTPAPTSYSAATAGSKTLYAWVRDAAGNVSALFTGQPCVIDTTKPTISTFTVPAYSASTTINGISVTAADAIGVTGYLITESTTPPAANAVTVFPEPTSFTASGTGVKTLYVWARDAAGNVSALYTGRSVIIDTIRPTIDSFTVPATSASLTISGISITASDAIGVIGYLITESSTPPAAGAVILTPAPTSYTASTAGTKTLYAWARDAAGNVSSVFTARTCSIDTSIPTINTFTVPAFSASLTISGISLSAADNIGVSGYLITESATPPAASAVTLTPAPTSYTAASAGFKTMYAWSRDAAGNVSALFAGQTCVVDLTKPVVNSFTIPASSTSLTVSGIAVSASDNTGVTGYLITESSTAPAAAAVTLSQPPTSYVATSSGSKTLYAWARDAAGNVSLSKSAVVTINPVVGSYPSLQNAYNTVPSGGLLFIGEGTLTETFTANRNVTVTVEGGYDAAFADNPGFTVINGKVTVQAGKIVFEKIKVR